MPIELVYAFVCESMCIYNIILIITFTWYRVRIGSPMPFHLPSFILCSGDFIVENQKCTV